MKIEMGKEYVTRRGDPVRIYCVDGGGVYPVHGSIYMDNEWHILRWDDFGVRNTHGLHQYELRELREQIKRTYWVNVYNKNEHANLANISYGFTSKEAADEGYLKDLEDGVKEVDRLACVQVTLSCMEGDGLEEEQ